jgi:hypothetical protein
VGKEYRLDYPVLSNDQYQFEYTFDFSNMNNLVGIDIKADDVDVREVYSAAVQLTQP